MRRYKTKSDFYVGDDDLETGRTAYMIHDGDEDEDEIVQATGILAADGEMIYRVFRKMPFGFQGSAKQEDDEE